MVNFIFYNIIYVLFLVNHRSIKLVILNLLLLLLLNLLLLFIITCNMGLCYVPIFKLDAALSDLYNFLKHSRNPGGIECIKR